MLVKYMLSTRLFLLTILQPDLVIWDSHPLALGATPRQVIIDGIPQIEKPYTLEKPDVFQRLPKVPDFDKEAKDAIRYDGLPPLKANRTSPSTVVFYNVRSLYSTSNETVQEAFDIKADSPLNVVVVTNGSIICSGPSPDCLTVQQKEEATFVDLEGGSISPGLVSFGSPLGLQHIDQEESTNDGDVFDPLINPVPSIMGGDTSIIRAVDGLLFGSRDAL
jgi:hypothetical protein